MTHPYLVILSHKYMAAQSSGFSLPDVWICCWKNCHVFQHYMKVTTQQQKWIIVVFTSIKGHKVKVFLDFLCIDLILWLFFSRNSLVMNWQWSKYTMLEYRQFKRHVTSSLMKQSPKHEYRTYTFATVSINSKTTHTHNNATDIVYFKIFKVAIQIWRLELNASSSQFFYLWFRFSLKNGSLIENKIPLKLRTRMFSFNSFLRYIHWN